MAAAPSINGACGGRRGRNRDGGAAGSWWAGPAEVGRPRHLSIATITSRAEKRGIVGQGRAGHGKSSQCMVVAYAGECWAALPVAGRQPLRQAQAGACRRCVVGWRVTATAGSAACCSAPAQGRQCSVIARQALSALWGRLSGAGGVRGGVGLGALQVGLGVRRGGGGGGGGNGRGGLRTGSRASRASTHAPPSRLLVLLLPLLGRRRCPCCPCHRLCRRRCRRCCCAAAALQRTSLQVRSAATK